MKQVIMKAAIDVTAPKGHKDYFIGGFNFIIDGNQIPFDFNATVYNLDTNKENGNDIIYYESGRGIAFNEFDIADEYYSEDYKELGLTEEDITAEFLSKVSEIEEFYFYPSDYTGWFYYQIISIDFYNETGTEFSVSKEVIDIFNSKIQMDVTTDKIYSDDFDYNGDELIE